MQKNSENKSQIDWKNLIAEQENSGLTQKEFCNQRGLVLSQFVYHRISKKKMTQPAGSVFKPVKVISKEAPATSGNIRLSLPNGFQCSFPCSFDVGQIKRLIEVLLSC
ncbi:MAG TPA: hypothetical protein VLI69_03915 [Gammaproteobacteria bacterium]|nr:hypothetical protein [Gammaproteobacteria bacterium]